MGKGNVAKKNNTSLESSKKSEFFPCLFHVLDDLMLKESPLVYGSSILYFYCHLPKVSVRGNFLFNL